MAYICVEFFFGLNVFFFVSNLLLDRSEDRRERKAEHKLGLCRVNRAFLLSV